MVTQEEIEELKQAIEAVEQERNEPWDTVAMMELGAAARETVPDLIAEWEALRGEVGSQVAPDTANPCDQCVRCGHVAEVHTVPAESDEPGQAHMACKLCTCDRCETWATNTPVDVHEECRASIATLRARVEKVEQAARDVIRTRDAWDAAAAKSYASESMLARMGACDSWREAFDALRAALGVSPVK